LRARITEQAGNRCGYCRAPQQHVYETLHIEHIEPRAHGGGNDEENLWLACSLCNRYKSDKMHGRDPVTGRWVRLFNHRAYGMWTGDG
jgi:5-methylcytosine-specific restriction endonuclease McrA